MKKLIIIGAHPKCPLDHVADVVRARGRFRGDVEILVDGAPVAVHEGQMRRALTRGSPTAWVCHGSQPWLIAQALAAEGVAPMLGAVFLGEAGQPFRKLRFGRTGELLDAAPPWLFEQLDLHLVERLDAARAASEG